MSELSKAGNNHEDAPYPELFDPAQQHVTIYSPKQLRDVRLWAKERLTLYTFFDRSLIDDIVIVVAEYGNNTVNYDRLLPFRRGDLDLCIEPGTVCVTACNPLPPIQIMTPEERDELVLHVNNRLHPDPAIAADETGVRGRGLAICGTICAERGGVACADIVTTSDEILLRITTTLPYTT
jgi:hypothetical protein